MYVCNIVHNTDILYVYLNTVKIGFEINRDLKSPPQSFYYYYLDMAN